MRQYDRKPEGMLFFVVVFVSFHYIKYPKGDRWCGKAVLRTAPPSYFPRWITTSLLARATMPSTSLSCFFVGNGRQLVTAEGAGFEVCSKLREIACVLKMKEVVLKSVWLN